MGAGFADVDWSTLPVPEDDGAARHLAGASVVAVALQSTAGESPAASRPAPQLRIQP